MLPERIEGKWIDCFERTLANCKVGAGDSVVILSETLSRQTNVHLAELALLRLGAEPFHVVIPSRRTETNVGIRSTGCSTALGGNRDLLRLLVSPLLIVDMTVEGLLHARETNEILQAGARILYISNEHPEILERLGQDHGLRERVRRASALLGRSSQMKVVSPAGTDLTVDVQGAKIGGGWGCADEPGRRDHWPGGLVTCYPLQGCVNGTVVLAAGDINLTFKRYLESPVVLTIENDRIVEIGGAGLDAELMRSYFAAWDDENAYYTAHLGWGMNQAARWDSMILYDGSDHNGVEQRAFAGNFLFSTGANPFAKRHTLGHFDIPMRNCGIRLDGRQIVEAGRLVGEFRE